MLTASLGQPLLLKHMSGCNNLTGSGFAELHINVFNGRMSGKKPKVSQVRKEAQVAFNIVAPGEAIFELSYVPERNPVSVSAAFECNAAEQLDLSSRQMSVTKFLAT
jgi:hypothetical protein